jgi:hypothetical protein
MVEGRWEETGSVLLGAVRVQGEKVRRWEDDDD